MMYSEFIGIEGVPIGESMAPDCLCDPSIEIIKIESMGVDFDNIYMPEGKTASLLRVYVSDETVSFLQLKYTHAVSNIFTKVDK